MRSDHEVTRAVQSWLRDGDDVLPERVLDDVMDLIPTTAQRMPLWRAWRKTVMAGTFKFAVAGLALVALAFVGFGLLRSNLGPVATPTTFLPTAAPTAPSSPSAPPPSETPAAEPTPSATPVAGPNGLVAYPICTPGGYPSSQTCRIWVVNPDGSSAHELLPYEPNPEVPDYQNSPDYQYPLAWSPDGSRLLYAFSRVVYAGIEDGVGTVHSGLALTNTAGSEPQEFEALCPAEPAVETDQYNFCEFRLYDRPVVTFSPDGSRVAYVIHEDWGSGNTEVEASALAILDLSTGLATRLDSTQTTNPTAPCRTASSQGNNSSPAWSPDGTHLAFVRSEIGPAENERCQNGLFTVRVDSGVVSDVMVSREHLFQDAHWSLDGERLLFHQSRGAAGTTMDVHTILVDGSGLQALTNDDSSMWPQWTRDERIVFLRQAVPDSANSNLWSMDADGGNASMLEPTIPALTAAGCLVCPYPINGTTDFFDNGQLNKSLWQPVPPGQP